MASRSNPHSPLPSSRIGPCSPTVSTQLTAAAYRPGVADEWSEAFDRLRERFPGVSAERVAQALREAEGHAGVAARSLREQAAVSVKEYDLDDVEHVATLLSSPPMFKRACEEQFRRFNTNGDGVLDWDEVVALTGKLYFKFGLERPSDASLRAFFDSMDENKDGVLSEGEFSAFFESFLRHAFFEPSKLKRIVRKATQRTPAGSRRSSPASGVSSPKSRRSSPKSRRSSPKSRRSSPKSRLPSPRSPKRGGA